MSRLRAVLFACGVLAVGAASGASPDPKDLAVPPEDVSKARELVRRLGSDSYRDREEAQAELAKMGRRARQALVEAAVGEADPEIRARAVRLLPKSEADELKARVDTYLADKDGKFEHRLPGLKAFAGSLGGAAKTRELYVEILKSPYNLDVLAAMDRGPEDGGRAVSDRRNSLFTDMIQRNVPAGGGRVTQPKQPSLSDVAVVLFAETHVPHQHIPRSTIQWNQVSGVTLLNQSSAAMTALNGSGPHAEVFRAVVGKWLASREDPVDLAQLVYQLGNANFKQFPESLPLLRRIALMDAMQGYSKGYAINYLVQQRGKDEIPFLRAVVRNEVRVGDYPDGFKKGRNPDDVAPAGADAMVTQMWFQNPGGAGAAPVAHTVTVRDVAFAHLLVQHGLNMRDYGFESPPGQNFNFQPANFGQYAFTSDEKRHAGYVKFGWWQMKEGIKKRGILLPHFRNK